MDVITHFSCYTRLPVALADVQAHVTEQSGVAECHVYPVDIDPGILAGFCLKYIKVPHNSINGHPCAVIAYSRHLKFDWANLVICKELLHLLDGNSEIAQTREQVATLIDEIVLPHEMAVGPVAESDRRGLLVALAVLMPRGVIDELRPRVQSGDVSIETIAQLARLPEGFVRVAFSAPWCKLIEDL